MNNLYDPYEDIKKFFNENHIFFEVCDIYSATVFEINYKGHKFKLECAPNRLDIWSSQIKGKWYEKSKPTNSEQVIKLLKRLYMEMELGRVGEEF